MVSSITLNMCMWMALSLWCYCIFCLWKSRQVLQFPDNVYIATSFCFSMLWVCKCITTECVSWLKVMNMVERNILRYTTFIFYTKLPFPECVRATQQILIHSCLQYLSFMNIFIIIIIVIGHNIFKRSSY